MNTEDKLKKFYSDANDFMKFTQTKEGDEQLLTALLDDPELLGRFGKALDELSSCVNTVKNRATRDRSPKRKDKTYAIYAEVKIKGKWQQCNTAQTDKIDADSVSDALWAWWSTLEEKAELVPRPMRVPCFKKRVILHRLYSDDEDIVLNIEGDENFID